MYNIKYRKVWNVWEMLGNEEIWNYWNILAKLQKSKELKQK